MCIGVPGQIRTIDGNQAKVDVCGIQRDVDLTLVGSCDENGQPRVGQWVLVHVGFAMSVINEAEARDTLDALQNMFDVEPDVGALLYGEEKCSQVNVQLLYDVNRQTNSTGLVHNRPFNRLANPPGCVC